MLGIQTGPEHKPKLDAWDQSLCIKPCSCYCLIHHRLRGSSSLNFSPIPWHYPMTSSKFTVKNVNSFRSAQKHVWYRTQNNMPHQSKLLSWNQKESIHFTGEKNANISGVASLGSCPQICKWLYWKKVKGKTKLNSHLTYYPWSSKSLPINSYSKIHVNTVWCALVYPNQLLVDVVNKDLFKQWLSNSHLVFHGTKISLPVVKWSILTWAWQQGFTWDHTAYR